MERIIKFVSGNLWVTFFLNCKGISDLGIWIFSKIKPPLVTDNPTVTTDNMTDSSTLYNDCMLLIISIILYFVLKAFFKVKKEADESNKYWMEVITDVSRQLTDNINDSASILNTKINYTNFCIVNIDLDDDAFVNKLRVDGFSKEDLEEIKVDKEFIRQHKNKLLPRSVMKKYKEPKYELDKFNKLKKNEPDRD